MPPPIRSVAEGSLRIYIRGGRASAREHDNTAIDVERLRACAIPIFHRCLRKDAGIIANGVALIESARMLRMYPEERLWGASSLRVLL
jgi:hypothetical protein